MKLVEETKTYVVPLDEVVEFPNVYKLVEVVLMSFPDWGLVSYHYDKDTWSVTIKLRRRY